MINEIDGEIVTAQDQPILFDPAPILNDIDVFYENALTTDNPALTILSRAKEMLARFRAEGLALCKLLHMMKKDWNKFGIKEDFEDSVFGIIGLQKVTIDRYVTIWDMFDKGLIPKDVEPYIMSLPLRSQVPIAKALEQGHEFSAKDWQKVINSPDNVSLRDVVRTIKDEPLRKSGIMFYLKLNGDLTAKDSAGIEHFIGWLDVKGAEKDTVIQRCIERIVDNSYIIKET